MIASLEHPPNGAAVVRLRARPALLVGSFVLASTAMIAAGEPVDTEWPAYGGSNRSAKYSPLDQIDATNVSRLQIAWEWESADAAILDAHPDLRPGEFQATPLAIDGVLYVSTAMSQVAAVDARSGETLWVRDPGTWRRGPATSKGFMHRGVAWFDDGEKRRIFIGTGDGRLLALDPASGEPIVSFGEDGEVDLLRAGLPRPIEARPSILYGITSPPLVVGDVVIVGGYILDRTRSNRMPRGDVRAFDARTGEHRWTFHTVPLETEPGIETWGGESWRYTGNANAWAPMSADGELGIVYLPLSAPTNNFFGGERPGDNLYGNCLVALRAATGELLWHYQIVHHDIWDYDLPAAPILADVTIGGEPRRVVAQLTKHGFAFVFDRVTGEPVWPIEERPVAASKLSGEIASPTQPFPTRPAPFERQGLSEGDLVDFTPELRAEALELLAELRHGPLFTPIGKPMTALVPGVVGGANWTGAALDPKTGILYVPSVTAPTGLSLGPAGEIETDFTHEIAGGSRLPGPRGLPLVKPPYGRITAIDLASGEHLWMRPNGDGPRRHPAFEGKDPGPLGSSGRAPILATATLLFVAEGPQDANRAAEPKLRAFDKATGEVLWTLELPDHAVGAPMTYAAGGTQYLVVSTGFRRRPHRLIALALAAP